MLTDPQIFLLWLFLSTAIYWTVPIKNSKVRGWTLVSLSSLLIFAIAPAAFFVCLFLCVATWLWAIQIAKNKKGKCLLFGVGTLLLPLIAFRTFYSHAALLHTLGVAFATLKSISVLLDMRRKTSAPTFCEVLLLNTFFPIYGAGPVEKLDRFAEQHLSQGFSSKFFVEGLARVSLGLFKCLFVAEQLIQVFLKSHWNIPELGVASYSSSSLWAFVFLKFLYTYTNFSGYSDIAIGCGRIFGLNIMENFQWPILAKNLQEFWRRWHISLGQWVIQNLYFPLMATIRIPWGPTIASVLTFLALGLWHESSWNYVAWGVLHGAGLALVQFIHRRLGKTQTYKFLKTKRAYAFVAWGLTIAFVSWVQTIANLPTLEESVRLTVGLFTNFYG